MHKNTLLLVDDDKFTRQVYKVYFEKHGYVIMEATNGNDATRLLDTHPDISVVLLDLLMPMHDGFNFMQNFTKTSSNPGHQFKIILVTGLDEDEYRTNVMVKHIDTSKVEGYFNKPVDLKELISAVDELHKN